MNAYSDGSLLRGSRFARQAQNAGLYQLDGKRHVRSMGGWMQKVVVGGKFYILSVQAGSPSPKLVYGKRGRRWSGHVQDSSGKTVWSGQVFKSDGVFMLLRLAGLVPFTDRDLETGEALVAWAEAARKMAGAS